MWKRGLSLALVSFILVLMISGLFTSVSLSPVFTVQSSNTVQSGYIPKSVVNVAYLTNQSSVQKWEKYFTSNSSQANLQSVIGFLAGLGTRHTSRPECNTSADYIFTTLQSYGYSPSRDYFSVIWQGVPYTTQNIYCVKPSASPDVILFACHYDSIRVTRIGETIIGIQNTNCPGAVDDAAGVAALLEVARLLADVSLDKTLVFAFLSGEEGNSTSEHWFGSEQLINQGYSLFTSQFSNIKRVIYLDTLGEPPYGEPHGNITIYSNILVFPNTVPLIGAASDLGINVVSEINPRVSSSLEAQKQFCSEWRLQLAIPTVTISQENWALATSDRLTSVDTASIVDYTFVENVTKIVTASIIREFYNIPPSSTSYKTEWSEITNQYSNKINLFERDYSEYLASPNSDVIIIGPELNFSNPELQQLVAINKPIICTGENGAELLNSLGAGVTSVSTDTDYVSLTRADLFFHPVWENVEQNITVAINQGDSTLLIGGSNLFSFLEYEGDCWLGFYYGHPSLRYVFYFGRDDPANLSGQAKHILSNLISWGSKQEEHVLQLQPQNIVAGERVNLIMAIRSALSWEVVEADTVNLTVTQNGEQVYHGSLSTSSGYFSVDLILNLGDCIFTASTGSISTTRKLVVVAPFRVQIYSPFTSVQNQYFPLALRIDSLSSSEQKLNIFIPELQVFTPVNLPPNESVMLYIPAVYNPASPYEQGAHLFTVLVQGLYPFVSALPVLISLSARNLILGYLLPLIALLAVGILVYRRIYLVKPPRSIQFREAKRVERRKYFDLFVLEDTQEIEAFKDELKEMGFEEKVENRFYNPEAIVEIQIKDKETHVRIFSSQSEFYRMINGLKLSQVEFEFEGGLENNVG